MSMWNSYFKATASFAMWKGLLAFLCFCEFSNFANAVSGEEFLTGRKSLSPSESGSCDLTKGSWVLNRGAKSLLQELNKTTQRPAETYANYDCSARLTSLRLPNIDHYSHTLPFCERVTDNILKNIAMQSVQYRWVPKQCVLEKFNGEKFARYLSKSAERPNGRWLYFVGDSTLLHMYDSLVCLLGEENVDALESEYAQEELDATFHKLPAIYSMKKIGVIALRGGGRIYFLKSNHLVSEYSGLIDAQMHRLQRVLVQHVLEDKHNSSTTVPPVDGNVEQKVSFSENIDYHEIEIPWIRQIRHMEEGKDDILIFNAGVHGGIHRRLVQHVLQYLSKYFHGRAIYRTNIPGSYECLQGKIKHSSSGPLHHHWSKFQEWDELWKDESRKMYQRLEIMDITNLSVQRRESHPVEIYGYTDCLHFCLPGGPVDAWNKILYNLLLQANTHV